MSPLEFAWAAPPSPDFQQNQLVETVTIESKGADGDSTTVTTYLMRLGI